MILAFFRCLSQSLRMSPQAFNVVLFVADFAAAVDRLQRRFGSRAACPSVPWHRALREAEYADTRRLIGARHAELDAVHHRVTYCEAVLRLEHGADEGPAGAAGRCGASGRRQLQKVATRTSSSQSSHMSASSSAPGCSGWPRPDGSGIRAKIVSKRSLAI